LQTIRTLLFWVFFGSLDIYLLFKKHDRYMKDALWVKENGGQRDLLFTSFLGSVSWVRRNLVGGGKVFGLCINNCLGG